MTSRPIPEPTNATEAIVALAAAARQSTMDDEGSAFVAEHLLRTLKYVWAIEAEVARLKGIVGE